MKLVFFTDPHDTSKNPGYRKDDYHKTILRKIEWVLSYCREINAIPICGGDIFHMPGVSNSTIGDMLSVLKRSYCPIYAIAGNHDLYGNTSSSIDKTGIGVLFKTDYLVNLCEYPNDYFSLGRLSDNHHVYLAGAESKMGIDDSPESYLFRNVKKEMENDGDPDAVLVGVVHGMLVSQKSSVFKCVSLDEVQDTEADVLLTGHDHSGLIYQGKNNKWFCNPGALGRITTSVNDVNLTVKVAVVDIISKKDIHVYFRELPEDIARPAWEVLDIEAAVAMHQAQKSAEAFVAQVQSMKVDAFAEGTEDEILDHFIEELGCDISVKDTYFQYLREAEELLKKGD